jgi:hypothetical protein
MRRFSCVCALLGLLLVICCGHCLGEEAPAAEGPNATPSLTIVRPPRTQTLTVQRLTEATLITVPGWICQPYVEDEEDNSSLFSSILNKV